MDGQYKEVRANDNYLGSHPVIQPFICLTSIVTFMISSLLHTQDERSSAPYIPSFPLITHLAFHYDQL